MSKVHSAFLLAIMALSSAAFGTTTGALCIFNGAVHNSTSVDDTQHPYIHLVDNFPAGCYFRWATSRKTASRSIAGKQ